MKKFAKTVLVLLLMLLLTLGVAACNGGESGSGSKDDQNTNTPGDNNDPEPDPKPDPKPDPDPEPGPVDVGVFAQKWVDERGNMLDLKAQTYAAAEKFTVKSMTGDGADAEIAVEQDGATYTLKLSDGLLGLYDGATAKTTFQILPDALAGMWKEDSEDSYIEYSIDPTPTKDGGFAWTTTSMGYAFDSGEANTAFSVEDGKPVITLTAYDYYGYPYYTFLMKEGAFSVDDGYGGVYDLVPAPFSLPSDLLYSGGTLGGGEDSVTLAGKTVPCELKKTDVGAGLSFTADGTKYLLRAFGDSLYLVGEKTELLVQYDVTLIAQEWYSSDGTLRFNGSNGMRVTAGGKDENVKFTYFAKDGAVAYSFACSLGNVTLTTIGKFGSALRYACEKNGKTTEDYLVLGSEREWFFEEMTDNDDVLTVAEDQTVTIEHAEGDTNTQKAAFTYLCDEASGLETVVLCIEDGEETMYLTHYASDYKNGLDAFMMYAYTNGVLLPYSAYFPTSDLDTVKAMFEGEYTTGGTEERFLSFEFSDAGNKVVYNGTSHDFVWSCTVDALDRVIPLANFTMDEEYEGEQLVSFNYCTVEPMGYSLTFSSFPSDAVSLDEMHYEYYVKTDVFAKVKGSFYTYHGEYYDETFGIDENGVFSITTTDTSDADGAVKSVSYDYMLQDFEQELISDTRHALTIGFNPFGEMVVFVYIYDFSYGMVMNEVYTKSELAPFVGTYSGDDVTLTLDRHGNIALSAGTVTMTEFNGTTASVEAVEGEDIVNYTAAFADGKVTLTKVGGEAKELTAFPLTPLAFVGNYTLGEDEISITSSAVSANITPELTILFNGDELPYELTVKNGKQVLTFGRLVNGAEVGYTMTLENGKITLAGDTKTATADACLADYSAFVLEDKETTVGDTTVTCLKKEGGKVPLFLLEDGTEGSAYSLSREGNVVTLEVSLGGETLQLLFDGETLSVQWKASDIPLPPPPPPLP